jgi:protein SCO1
MRKLRYMLWTLVAVATLAAGLVVVNLPQERASAPSSIVIGGPFTMTDQDGRPVTEKTFQGKARAMFLIFAQQPCHAWRN